MVNQSKKYSALEKELQLARNEISYLKETKTKFDLIANNVDEFVWLMNNTFEFTYISPSIKKILGYSIKEFLRFNLLTLLTEDSQQTIKAAIKSRTEGTSPNTVKKWLTQVKHKNGIFLWVESTTNPIIDKNGDFDGIIGVSRDVTTQISLEQKMQENEVNLQAQIDNTTDSIWSIDDAYCIKTLNKPFKTGIKMAFGADLEPGSSLLNILPEPFRSQWKERYDRALNGEQYTITDHFEFENLPQYVEVNFTPIMFNERVIGVTVFSRDITTQRLSQKKLTESSANLSSIIEHTDARIWSIDTEQNIITINKNFRNDFLAAFNVKLEKGSYALRNVPEPLFSIWDKRYKKVLSGEKVLINDELEIAGVPQFIEVSLSPITINDEIIGASCFFRDVSKQKIAEKALIESKAKYKSLVDNIPSVSYRCMNDKHWTMNFISNEIESLSGFKPEEFINNAQRSFADIIHKEDQEYVALVINEKIEIHESFSIEYRIIDRWNKTKWVHERGRGYYNEKGEVEYIDGVISDITIRKKSEQELQKSEQRFRILSDASIDMLSFNSRDDIISYSADILGRQLYKTTIISQNVSSNNNLSTCHITGYKIAKQLVHFNETTKLPKQLKEKLKDGKLIRVDDLPAYKNEVLNNINYKTIFNNKANLFCIGIIKDNEIYGILNFISKNGELIENKLLIESLANITSILIHRHQLIESIHHSEEKFRSLFENTSSVIAIVAPNKILMANKSFHNLLGYTKKEFLKLNPADLIYPTDREEAMGQLFKRLSGKDMPVTSLVHLIDKHFNEKWIDVSSTIINYEGEQASLIVGSDITERRKADLELNKFSTGIMNSPSSIVITDIDGTIEYVNPYFTEVTGYTLEEALGENPKILSSGNNPKELYMDMWNTILKGEVWNGELQNKTKSGKTYWEAVRIAPIFDEGKIITNFIAIKEDITERKHTLNLIEQSEKDLREINAKKDKFFSIIAHDLRSPFSGLAGLVQILKSSYSELSDAEIDRYLDLINQSAQNISKLLENLLSWAKSQTGKVPFEPEKLDLKVTVQECIEITTVAAKNKAIKTMVNVQPNTFIFADNNMLNTIIRNLLSNAIKYTNRNGKITVSSSIKTINKKQFNVVSISDNGVGIPKSKQSKIFKIEENYTTRGTEKEKGTGLGLLLCKEFVENHGGNIWCDSEENIGSTFFFSLPIKP